jgi:hypothetical protein
MLIQASSRRRAILIQASSRRPAIIENHHADGRSSSIIAPPGVHRQSSSFAPTSDLQPSSCHRAIINIIFMPMGNFQSSCADGRC